MEQSISRIKSQELTLDRFFFSLWTSGCAWALGIGKWEREWQSNLNIQC